MQLHVPNLTSYVHTFSDLTAQDKAEGLDLQQVIDAVAADRITYYQSISNEDAFRPNTCLVFHGTTPTKTV